MPVNTLEFAKILQQGLDKKAVHSLLTGWMDANAGQVKYTGGNEIKIPQMAVSGLGNYKRNETGGAFANGSIDLKYKTYELKQDRGRKFQLDAMDVDETNFVGTATNVMSVFQEEQVVAEIDAYRLSKLVQTAISVEGEANVEYEYEPTPETVLYEIKQGIKTIRENGYQGQLVIHANYDTVTALELAMANQLTTMTFSKDGVDTKVPTIDRCPIIETPQNRLYSKITLNDGTTGGQEAGGYKKADDGKMVNFVIAPVTAPIAVTKLDNMRIFDPQTNQNANAWAMDYRRYHDMWVMDNKKNLVYANLSEAKA